MSGDLVLDMIDTEINRLGERYEPPRGLKRLTRWRNGWEQGVNVAREVAADQLLAIRKVYTGPLPRKAEALRRLSEAMRAGGSADLLSKVMYDACEGTSYSSDDLAAVLLSLLAPYFTPGWRGAGTIPASASFGMSKGLLR